MLIKFSSRLYRAIYLAVILALTACASAAPATLTVTPTPPTASRVPPTVTPAPAGKRAVTFTTPDGVTLTGTLYGQGRVAVIFSNMGDRHEDTWAEMAQVVSDTGYLALTYEFRYWVNNKIDNALAQHVGDDLSAAVTFVRDQGAEQVVLVGASLGGMASAKVGASAKANAVIMLGSPLSAPSINLRVESSELQAILAPKLFVTSENDKTVAASALKEMYTLARDPKELEVYPGTAHGTDIFNSDQGAKLRDRLLIFITTHAPADGSAPTIAPPPTPIPALFTVYGDAPIVPHGASGAWDDRYTDPGAVVFHAGLFHMFRNGFRDWPASVQIGYVTSPDGLTWTKQDDEPVLKTDDVPYAGVAALASSVLVEDDGTWVLYFYTWQSKNYPSAGGIGRATAPEPTGPWTVDPELVLQPGASGAWDGRHVLAPDVFRTETGYVMYYSGYGLSGQQQIGRATSPDGIHWTKYDDPTTTTGLYAESDPVLQPDAKGAWDDGWVHQARVHPNGDGWVMLYRGTHANGTSMALGYATSADSIHWQRSLLNPILKTPAVNGAQYFWFTNSLYQDNTYFLFWEVDKAESTEIYLATHTGLWP